MLHAASPQNEFLKRNERLWMRPGRLYVPVWQFAGLDYEATTGNDIKSIGTGTPSATNMIIAEANTSGIVGLNLNTADNSVCHMLEVPADMDLSFPIYPYVRWTANNTSGSTEWVLFHKAFVDNATVLGSAEPAVVLDSVIGAHTMAGVAFTLMKTPEGRINGGTFPDTTESIQFKIQMHALVTITVPFLLGFGLRYTRKLLQYGSMKQEAKAATYIASEKYAN